MARTNRQLLLLAGLVIVAAALWTQNAKVSAARARYDVRGTLASNEVVLYTTTWCGYCKRLQHWLDDSGVPYRNLDIESTEAGRWGHEAVTGRHGGVPVTVIGQDVFAGLATEKIRKRLEKSGYSMRGEP